MTPPSAIRRASTAPAPVWHHLAALGAMVLAAALAVVLAPAKSGAAAAPDLGALVPARLGDWREVRSRVLQVDLTPRRDGEEAGRTTDEPYDQTVMRTYARADGATVMLALAYGGRQRQEVKIHRPELCYLAQGFAVARRDPAPIVFADGRAVTATRLVARSDRRVEPVTYWIRIGDEITAGAVDSRLAILREGLKGRIPDGILVRVSSAYAPSDAAAERAYEDHQDFLRALLGALEPGARRILLADAGPRGGS
jgi:EpsI family protein